MTEHEYMMCKNEEIEVRLQFYREHKVLATLRGDRLNEVTV
jgi:hypothetical protein